MDDKTYMTDTYQQLQGKKASIYNLLNTNLLKNIKTNKQTQIKTIHCIKDLQ